MATRTKKPKPTPGSWGMKGRIRTGKGTRMDYEAPDLCEDVGSAALRAITQAMMSRPTQNFATVAILEENWLKKYSAIDLDLLRQGDEPPEFDLTVFHHGKVYLWRVQIRAEKEEENPQALSTNVEIKRS